MESGNEQSQGDMTKDTEDSTQLANSQNTEECEGTDMTIDDSGFTPVYIYITRKHQVERRRVSKGREKREMPGEKRHGSEFKRSALDGSEEQKDASRDHLEDSDSPSDINRDGPWGKGVKGGFRYVSYDTLRVQEIRRSMCVYVYVCKICCVCVSVCCVCVFVCFWDFYVTFLSRSSSEVSLHICLDSGVNCSGGQRAPRDASAASA
ncbi:hypothetical protein QTP70_025640 [Hemibagrus guttatus]|uniref:Uncharacterized protein n=1 Tax=Hemibagrus guttatus TaxID=175788 RepID=A0AAE0QXQ1_9TELE|nr:hypothetical protein QTP70_025640 [Hemibagrus guttatus]